GLRQFLVGERGHGGPQHDRRKNVGAVDHADRENGEGSECLAGGEHGSVQRERWNRADLLEQFERIELVPVLGEQAVADAPDVDRVHFDLRAAGRYAEEVAGMPAAVRVAANYGALDGDDVVGLNAEV